VKAWRCLAGLHAWTVRWDAEDRHPYRACTRCGVDEGVIPGDYPAPAALHEHATDFADNAVRGLVRGLYRSSR
jgi:hypothetical protein